MSITYLGAYLGLVVMVLQLFGIHVAEEELQKILNSVGAVVSLVLVIVGRHRKGGVSWLGTRTHSPKEGE